MVVCLIERVLKESTGERGEDVGVTAGGPRISAKEDTAEGITSDLLGVASITGTGCIALDEDGIMYESEPDALEVAVTTGTGATAVEGTPNTPSATVAVWPAKIILLSPTGILRSGATTGLKVLTGAFDNLVDELASTSATVDWSAETAS
jgi:hypothetical protein